MGSRSRKRRRIVTGDAVFAPREIPAADPTRPKRLRGQAAEDDPESEETVEEGDGADHRFSPALTYAACRG